MNYKYKEALDNINNVLERKNEGTDFIKWETLEVAKEALEKALAATEKGGAGMREYREIVKLYEYCEKIGVHAEISPMFDGFCIRFKNGGDVIQHNGSYGRDCGCVEPAIGSRLDYTAVPLKNAKALIRRHKEKLNSGLKGGEG